MTDEARVYDARGAERLSTGDVILHRTNRGVYQAGRVTRIGATSISYQSPDSRKVSVVPCSSRWGSAAFPDRSYLVPVLRLWIGGCVPADMLPSPAAEEAAATLDRKIEGLQRRLEELQRERVLLDEALANHKH